MTDKEKYLKVVELIKERGWFVSFFKIAPCAINIVTNIKNFGFFNAYAVKGGIVVYYVRFPRYAKLTAVLIHELGHKLTRYHDEVLAWELGEKYVGKKLLPTGFRTTKKIALATYGLK